MSALVTQIIADLVNEDGRYRAACERQLPILMHLPRSYPYYLNSRGLSCRSRRIRVGRSTRSYISTAKLSWIEFNRRVLEEAQRRAQSAAGTRQVCGDLSFEPGRVFYGARIGGEGADRPRRERADAERVYAVGAVCGDAGGVLPLVTGMPGGGVRRTAARRWRRRGSWWRIMPT